MNKELGTVLVGVAVLALVVVTAVKDPVSVEVVSEEGRVQVVEKTVGGTIGSDIYQDVSFQGKTAVNQWGIDVTTDYTLQAYESGALVFATASGSTTTLPAAKDGLNFKFIVGAALDTVNWIIDSAEGDNIYGTLSVNNADVACSAEDQLNFVTDGETPGDFVELVSDGSSWFITGSDVETAAKLTCTDPA